SRQSTVTIVFSHSVKASQLHIGDFLVLELSIKNRKKGDIWFYVVVDGAHRWAAYYYDPQTRTHGSGGFYIRNVSARSLKIVGVDGFLPSPYGNGPYGYRFRLASFSRTGPSCSKGCWDAVPDRNWLIHDWTPPFVMRWEVPTKGMGIPNFSLSPAEEPGVPVTFRVIDKGFSELRRWTLYSRLEGADEWTKAFQGDSERLVNRTVSASEGDELVMRLQAQDRAGNTVTAPVARTIVPYDDTSTAGQATFFGVWNENDEADSYRTTLHVSSTPLDSFSFTASARMYCIFYRASNDAGQANLQADNQSAHVDMAYSAFGDSHGITCLYFDTVQTRTAELKPTEGAINVDGYWFGEHNPFS
ncbi:MAG: hypothetical protein M3290_04495, partial [Actinomycetota bacterium]|nr:hypothetical protein [Actinomycetota bacterium]